MKLLQPFFTLMILSACLAIEGPPITVRNSSVYGIFTGTTPCGQMIRPAHNVSLETDCALVQWQLTLFQDPVTLQPTTYKLSSVNRSIVKGTNMYSEPGTKTETQGKWTIVQAAKTTFRLDSDKAGAIISFLKLSDKLIHLLDSDGKLMIGDESFSYTLSRVAN